MPDFIPGLELARLFFLEAVKPILDADFPDLRYDAALIHTGSEVLGFDTPMSRDHGWGPRCTLFVDEIGMSHQDAIKAALWDKLPYEFRGYPTSVMYRPEEPGTPMLDARTSGGVNHRVEIGILSNFTREYLGFDATQSDIPLAAWLAVPQQKFRTITSGGVFHNGIGGVDALRQRLKWYPHDLWLYLMAASWARIGQEEAFVGRTGDVGDELGSRIIAARLIRDMMQLAFLIEREYAPYPKWFGTGFARMACSAELTPYFHRALSAETWQERETHLSAAYSILAAMHNALKLTPELPTTVSPFHGRPYQVIHGNVFVDALINAIQDAEVRALAGRTIIGGIDHFSDSTDFRENAGLHSRIAAFYGN